MGDEEQDVVEATAEKVEPKAQTEVVTEEPEIIALLKEAKAEGKREAEEAYKGYQRVVSARENEVKELKKRLEEKPIAAPVTGLSNQVIELMERGEYDEAKKYVALQQQEQTRQAALQRQATTTEGHRQRIRQEIIGAGQDPDDEIFEDVFEAVDLADAWDGKFERADKKLKRVLKPKLAEAVKQSDIEERARQLLEKDNLLVTETGSPSAASQSFKQVRDRYIEDPDNKVNREAYLKVRAQRGL